MTDHTDSEPATLEERTEEAEASLDQAFQAMMRLGHSRHCVSRMVWGDGECECDMAPEFCTDGRWYWIPRGMLGEGEPNCETIPIPQWLQKKMRRLGVLKAHGT